MRIGATVWIYLRAAVLGAYGPRFTVQEQPILDTSRLQVAGAAGIGIGMW